MQTQRRKERGESQRFLLFSFATLGVFCAFAFAFADISVEAAVAGLQQRYAKVESLSAEFRQNYTGPGIEQSESGKVYMKRPGLMRWEYQQPETRIFIADGRETWLYAPADRQVTVRAVNPEELRNTPLQLLLGQAQILKSFTAAWDGTTRPKYQDSSLLRLTPRAAQSEYSAIVVEYDTRSFDLRRIIIRESSGNTSEFLLTNLAANPKLDKKLFEFKAPKGIELIRIDDK
jgi:outer membrane lipoprotein carrier protein